MQPYVACSWVDFVIVEDCWEYKNKATTTTYPNTNSYEVILLIFYMS